MDISATTQPKSDQQNYDDYGGGAKTLTITEVRPGTSEQPVEIHLAEFPGRPYKPSKSMRRVLLAAWGNDTDTYAGRRMRLKGDPTIKFGGTAVGGIVIEALSHISKPMSIALTVTKGKRAPFTVQPLQDAPTAPTRAERITRATTAIHNTTTAAELAKVWAQIEQSGLGDDPELIAASNQRTEQLRGNA
jgi:hypothetical protein